MSKNFSISIKNVYKEYLLYANSRDKLIDILKLNKLGFKLSSNPQRFNALSNISLDIERGQRIGIIGRNGAGKTTLLKLICGNFKPSAGSVFINGNVQALMNIGVGFHPEYTGRQNILASLHYNNLNKKDFESALLDIIDFCELENFIDQPFKSYSLGMQSRLQFACATAIKPEILIVDEILGAGDAYFSIKSSLRMEELTKSGCTLVLVSHSMAQILQFCEKVVWVEGGKIVKIGAAKEVVGEYEVFMSEKARVISGSRGQKSVSPLETDKTYSVILKDGKNAYRWASDPGVKLQWLKIIKNNLEVDFLLEGDSFVIRFCVQSELDVCIDAIFYINIISELGQRVTRVVSDSFRFDRIDQTRTIEVAFKDNLLGAGKYYINFLAVPDGAINKGFLDRRYDLVAKFNEFEISKILDYREPAVFYHPAEWSEI
jgi:lipopolysaccharide transport system ATP-binding protein